MAKKDGWFIRVCRDKCEAGINSIKFSCGRDSNDQDPWITWSKEGSPAIYEEDLPDHLRYRDRIWFKYEPYQSGSNGYACLCYASGVKKKFNYDGAHADEFNRDDSDSCDC